MVGHGEDFDANSEYGRCMTSKLTLLLIRKLYADDVVYAVLGRAEERLARLQDAYISQVNAGWLESLEHSLTQMKEYQV